DLQVQRCLERLAADALEVVVEGADKQLPAGFVGTLRRLLAQDADQRLKATATHVLEGGAQPGLGAEQRVVLLDVDQGAEGGVEDGVLAVVQQRAQRFEAARVVEGAEGTADLDARRRIFLTAEL